MRLGRGERPEAWLTAVAWVSDLLPFWSLSLRCLLPVCEHVHGVF